MAASALTTGRIHRNACG